MIRPVEQIREYLPVDEIKSATTLMLEQTQQSIYDNRTFYKNLIKHYGRQNLIDDVVGLESKLNIRMYATYGFVGDELEFISYFFSTVQANTLVWWLSDHEDIPPKRIATFLRIWAFAHWSDIAITKQ